MSIIPEHTVLFLQAVLFSTTTA
uniref:Uncharacterized protein n=1 Tax=Arundo donax TaxID=35708 RepID=A0A0A9HEP2_ARUDO